MKINVFNIDGDLNKAHNAVGIIVEQAIADLSKNGDVVEDVKAEEINMTFTFKMAGQDDYMVLSVVHDNMTEMFEIDYDLGESEVSDNVQLSLFADLDREVLSGSSLTTFPTVEPVLEDDLLEFVDEERIGDMLIVRYNRLDTGQKAERIFQFDRTSDKKKEHVGRLIQEYSLKE